MPEIKHQFTGGKMNKDLDERLVPNGEYRHAENIQVSTSEGSAVGTVQNILGNSLVSGQNFIEAGAVCVGSVADEANNKVYYFIVENNELLSNGGFNEDSSAWTLGTGWSWENGYIKGSSVATNEKINQSSIPDAKLIDGEEYRISFTVSNYVSGNINLVAINESGKRFIVNSFSPQNKTYEFVRELGTHTDTTSQSFYSRVYLQAGDQGFTGNIDNISIQPIAGYSAIIEYDVKSNFITPVLVDTGNVLMFQDNNIITGINIIDGMLFWTDNKNEPKKINIQRCIDGTDINGTTHTKFLNSKRGISTDIEEKDITVIKKAPSLAPKIELISERDPSKTYTGAMHITSSFDVINTSSFNLFGNVGQQTFNTRFDFSGLNVGDYFNTAIDTDVFGDSGFTLAWSPGDTVLFKEFINGEIPSLPITNYRIKTVVDNFFYPDSETNNKFTDEEAEVVENGSFSIPNDFGDLPKNFDVNGSGSNASDWTYESSYGRMSIATSGSAADKLYSTQNIAWDTDTLAANADTYRITVETSSVTPGGSFRVIIVSDIMTSNANTTNPYYWRSPKVETNGTHVFDIALGEDTAENGTNLASYANSFILYTGNSGFTGNVDYISIVNTNTANARVRFKIVDISGDIPTVGADQEEIKFAVDRQDSEDKLHEFKLPRFATRYRYQDGEYSAFSPFTQVAFLPGSFDYHPKKGYNLGMTNRLKSLNINVSNDTFPKDVAFVDILYKEDGSVNVYVLDSIKPTDWYNDYEVTSETLNRAVPSNQLIRPWDNVPKKALAQDVTGNRVVYANYEQGYDLIDSSGYNYKPDIQLEFESSSVIGEAEKSIKSIRDYQVGITFVDKYGRETPVIASQGNAPKSSKKLEKSLANKSNKMSVVLKNNAHVNGTEFFKFFVKETSGEYYNLAMDRFWDAEDDHAWVSFSSSDINKIDIDSFLILKKGIDSNDLIEDPARYKVIAIENEAPDYIKTKRTLIEAKQHEFGNDDTDIFGEDFLNNPPVSNTDFFKMKYIAFLNSSGAALDQIDGQLYIEFTDAVGSFVSDRYRVGSIETNFRQTSVSPGDAIYSVKLDRKLGVDVDFMLDSSGDKIADGVIVRAYNYKVENSPEFDGRFFVKLRNDSVFTQNIVNKANTSENYKVLASKKLYYLKDDIATTHHQDITGQSDGLYDKDSNGGQFGRYAAFFRNYKYDGGAASELNYRDAAGVDSMIDASPYRFGEGNDWKTEFLDYTSSGVDQAGSSQWGQGWENAWDNTGTQGSSASPSRSFTKAADQYPNQSTDEEEVWFIDAGNYEGSRWDSDSLSWQHVGLTSGTEQGISSSNSALVFRLGIGGIYDSNIIDHNSNPQSISGFFGIGVDGGNLNYQDYNTINLVKQFNASKKIKFNDDPKKEVYTVQLVTQYRRLRYNATKTPFSVNQYVHPDQDELAQLAPNLTKSWHLTVKNSDGDNVIGWNPTGALGPISGDGLSLAINHSSSVDTNDVHTNLYVVASSIVGVDTVTSSNYEIKVGMILVSHSNGGSGDVYDGTTNKEYLIVWKIEDNANATDKNIFLTGYSELLLNTHNIFSGNKPTLGQEMVFKQPTMNGYSQFSTNRINSYSSDYSIDNPGLYAVGYNVDFLESIEEEQTIPENPALWETEPKENTPLDVYYEASGLNPIRLNEETKHLAIPLNSKVTHVENSASIPIGNYINGVTYDTTVVTTNANPSTGISGWYLTIDSPEGIQSPFVGGEYISIGDYLQVEKSDGSYISVKVIGWELIESGSTRSRKIYINEQLNGNNAKYGLSWSNCFSFGNGVESNRIKDAFNLPYISNGARVSTVLEEEEDYKQERRKYGLIYSGIYNGVGNVNNLNQFIAGEKITKELNPIYGSIQKLHSRDSDLIALCEDKVLQIYANKDALFNADGNVNVTATNKVLGQSRPFVGEYGISTNPESFTSESYRVYFTDKVRGAVLRLSKDGLTPISDAGMKDYFKDNLKNNDKIIGSYDDRKNEYNITLPTTNTTISYKEDVRGWVSFKSFVPENGISCSNDYYTFKNGKIYKHHDDSTDRNTFYGESLKPSVLEVVLNDSPDVIKSFHTLNYSGEKDWTVSKIYTNKQEGSISEFIEKEGRWSNYIKGIDADLDSNSDFGALNIQGIGKVKSIDNTNNTIKFNGSINSSVQVGDVLYYENNGIQKVSDVVSVSDKELEVSSIGSVSVDDFVFFAKNNVANVSSLLGHYASAIFENNSTNKTEIFSVGSEITESSK